LGVVVFLLLLAGAGVGAWYFLVYTQSPQYALNQFFAAAKANDKDKIDQYTDKSGGIVAFLGAVASMAPNLAGLDPVRMIYPGYGGADMGQTQKITVESLTVEGDTAKAQVTMEIARDGKTETIKPTYVLKKTDQGWKVSVQDTAFGSFKQFVPGALRQSTARMMRQARSNPIAAQFLGQLQNLRSEIDRYPQFRDFLKSAGAL
jgi:ketosteroid isomerase-like protein